MSSASSATPIKTAYTPLAALEADLLVVPWFDDDRGGAVAGLDEGIGGEITRAMSSLEFVGKRFDIFLANVVDSRWKSRRVAFVGAGRRSDFDADLGRRLA